MNQWLNLFNKFLNRLELLVARIAHQLEEGHLDGGGARAGAHHLVGADPLVWLGARGDAVGEDVNLVAAREEVVRRLVDADVRLDAAEQDLARARRFEARDELARAAGAEGRLLYGREAFGQHGANLRGRAAKSLRVLLRDDDGAAEHLHGECDARGHLGEVLYGLAKRLLHVNDGERRLAQVKRVLVPHESPPDIKRAFKHTPSAAQNRAARNAERTRFFMTTRFGSGV